MIIVMMIRAFVFDRMYTQIKSKIGSFVRQIKGAETENVLKVKMA